MHTWPVISAFLLKQKDFSRSQAATPKKWQYVGNGATQRRCYYRVNHKKRDILFLTITLASPDGFLWFLYHFNCEEILHATVVKFTTSPIHLNCVRNLLRKFK